jgi:ferredoxin
MTLVPAIDAPACSAHGDCAVVAPDVFCIDDTDATGEQVYP